MRVADIARVGWLSGFAVVGGLALAVAMRPAAPATSAPVIIDVEGFSDLGAQVRDNVGEQQCASDVTVDGTHIYVHLRLERDSCTGVVRVYRVEGDRMIFERELIDI